MSIISVLKREMDNETMAIRYDEEDFNCKSQLIVQQSQEAIFYYSGVAQDVFGPGRYSLDTANLPVLTKLLKRATGDESPFHAVVFFVNTTELMGIDWGTEQFKVYEKINDQAVPFNVGSRGKMSIRITNSRLLIEKIVGTEGVLKQNQFVDKVFELVTTEAKTLFSTILSRDDYELFSVDQKLKDLGNEAFPLINEALRPYGVELGMFVVSAIKLPDGDPNFEAYKKMKSTATIFGQQNIELELLKNKKRAEAEMEAIEASGRTARRNIEGYTYQQERGFDIADKAAANEGIGQYTGMGVGLGMMAGVGGAISGQVGNAINQAFDPSAQPQQQSQQVGGVVPNIGVGVSVAPSQNTINCPSCNAVIPAGKFCMQCGYKLEAKTCGNCGAKIVAGAKFCLECGTPVSE